MLLCSLVSSDGLRLFVIWLSMSVVSVFFDRCM